MFSEFLSRFRLWMGRRDFLSAWKQLKNSNVENTLTVGNHHSLAIFSNEPDVVEKLLALADLIGMEVEINNAD